MRVTLTLGTKFRVPAREMNTTVADPHEPNSRLFNEVDIGWAPHDWHKMPAQSMRQPGWWVCRTCCAEIRPRQVEGAWQPLPNPDPTECCEVACESLDDHVVIRPGSFVVAESMEEVTVPADVVAATVVTAEGYLLLGVTVHAVVRPGESGKITLVLTNSGPFSVKAYCADGVGQLTFLRGDVQ